MVVETTASRLARFVRPAESFSDCALLVDISLVARLAVPHARDFHAETMEARGIAHRPYRIGIRIAANPAAHSRSGSSGSALNTIPAQTVVISILGKPRHHLELSLAGVAC